MHDKELASSRVECLAPSKGEHSTLVGDRVCHAIGLKFSFDTVAGAAHPGALGITALDHETRDNPVKDQAVIKALTSQREKIANRLRRSIRIEFSDNLAAVLHLNCDNGILCHMMTSCLIAIV